MHSIHDLSLREKFSRIGRKLGWFDKPLIAKIESLQREMKEKEGSNHVGQSARVSEDFSLTGKEDETILDKNDADASESINGSHMEQKAPFVAITKNANATDESVIILDDDDYVTTDSSIKNEDNSDVDGNIDVLINASNGEDDMFNIGANGGSSTGGDDCNIEANDGSSTSGDDFNIAANIDRSTGGDDFNIMASVDGSSYGAGDNGIHEDSPSASEKDEDSSLDIGDGDGASNISNSVDAIINDSNVDVDIHSQSNVIAERIAGEQSYVSDGDSTVDSDSNGVANDNASVASFIGSDVDDYHNGCYDDFGMNDDVRSGSNTSVDQDKEEAIQNGGFVGLDHFVDDDDTNDSDTDATSDDDGESNIVANIGDHDTDINDREDNINDDSIAICDYSKHSAIEDSFMEGKKNLDEEENSLDYKDNRYCSMANPGGGCRTICDTDDNLDEDDKESVTEDDVDSTDDQGNAGSSYEHDSYGGYFNIQEEAIEPGATRKSLEKRQKPDAVAIEGVQLADNTSNFEDQVNEDEEEKATCTKLNSEHCKIGQSMERGCEEKSSTFQESNEASSGDKEKAAFVPEMDEVPAFEWSSLSKDCSIASELLDQDKAIIDIDTSNDLVESSANQVSDDLKNNIKDSYSEEKKSEELIKSANLDFDDDDAVVETARPRSCMTDCSSENSISDSPALPSLRETVLKTKRVFSPDCEGEDEDDFESFLQKMKNPKKVLSYTGQEQKKETESLEAFILSDDDNEDYNDLEEDVFVDPGFTPEEYYSDEENADCNIPKTPAEASFTPFKEPSVNFPSKTPLLSKTTKPGCFTEPPSRPKSVLDSLLASYSKEKDFKKYREQLATDLFKLYNRTVFDNQLPSDFQITWNKKMRSTAGFCYYTRKNSIRLCRIELADKVIDSADRLRDTLIHEMCHAAAWVISGIKAGHGSVWKRWTMKAQYVHQNLPPISRCHSFAINTKYTYRCTKCGNSFGRHSKSVNLEKSCCARCHGRLELVPQLKKDGTPQARTPNRFALFVKENFARVKKDNDRFTHQEVMKALSSEFSKLST